MNNELTPPPNRLIEILCKLLPIGCGFCGGVLLMAGGDYVRSGNTGHAVMDLVLAFLITAQAVWYALAPQK